MSKTSETKQAKRAARDKKNAEMAQGIKNSGKSKYAKKQKNRGENSPFSERG